ncbi:MAG: ribosome maturation factor RimM [Pseudomonadota bacterium]
MNETAPDRRVCVGAVSGVHGVRGAVRIKPFTETPKGVAAYGPVTDEEGIRRFDIAVVGEHKGTLLATLSGVTDRTAAEALKGMRLYVDRTALPPTDEDEFYYEDLVGLSAVTVDGDALGTVIAVFEFGAGDVIEVQGADRQSVMLPFTRAVVPTVDIAARRIIVDPPEFMADEEETDDRDMGDGR